ncbi:multidrug resistance protein, MATE family [Rheinheimera pacifica]|uniref:Multidrug resistance protein, MATE family n=1 Tax=Rheinheimera pacifica TaxID=173990 RepID=A0A1H6KLV6_9GAMM|nr:hypothetical protein [Rheinheimera pacifica]SEH72530.1 multidrug resistance protein, MATE family [Rheinheimera pacifica]
MTTVMPNTLGNMLLIFHGSWHPLPLSLGMATTIRVGHLVGQQSIMELKKAVSACALRGMKVTKPVFFITFIAYWPIGFGLGAVLGLTNWLVPAMGAHGFWIGIIVGLSVAAVLLAIILKRTLLKLEQKAD